MAEVLLLDFGASRIKCALWSSAVQSLTAEREVPAPQTVKGSYGEVEIDPEAYWRALEATAGALLERHPHIDSLWICAEMHGIIVADANGSPLTPYISWRDERGTFPQENGRTTFDRLCEKDDSFFARSGMRLRAGLPVLTLAHLRGNDVLPRAPIRLFTLVDWLLWRGGERAPSIHDSLAAGTGFYDIHQGCWSPELLTFAGLDSSEVDLPSIRPAGVQLGSISLVGREINVYGGLGDLQAAMFGAGFPRNAGMAVNLGTGSQVLAQEARSRPDVEARPGADGRAFSAITHIPSGRALNVFSGCLDGIARLGGGTPFFWDMFAALRLEQVLACPIEVDPAVFAAAWNYRDGGSIRWIREGSFAPEQLLAGIAKGWLSQYVKAMDLLDPGRALPTFVLAGGLSRRAEFIGPCLSGLSRRQCVQILPRTGEETLDGLLALAEGSYEEV